MSFESVKNKRKYERVSWAVPVVLEGQEGRQVKCRTVDVSDGGALLSVHKSLAPGAEIKVRFKVDRFELGPEKARVLRNDSAFGGSEIMTAVEFQEPHPGLTELMKFEREKKQWVARHSLVHPRD